MTADSSKTITRYDYETHGGYDPVYEDKGGHLVLYSDHAAEIARLVGALKEVEDMADGEYLHSSIAHFARKALDSAGG